MQCYFNPGRNFYLEVSLNFLLVNILKFSFVKR